MKGFKMQQLFVMTNDKDEARGFAKGVADGKEAYAFIITNGVFQSSSKEEMTQIFNELKKLGWTATSTITVEDIPILGKEPKSEEGLKAPKEPKRRPKKTAKAPTKTKAPKAPKEKVPPMWLFPKKEGRCKVYAAENFNIDAYKAKAAELGLLTAKGKVLPENREKVYIALGAKKNPEREAYDKAKEVK